MCRFRLSTSPPPEKSPMFPNYDLEAASKLYAGCSCEVLGTQYFYDRPESSLETIMTEACHRPGAQQQQLALATKVITVIVTVNAW